MRPQRRRLDSFSTHEEWRWHHSVVGGIDDSEHGRCIKHERGVSGACGALEDVGGHVVGELFGREHIIEVCPERTAPRVKVQAVGARSVAQERLKSPAPPTLLVEYGDAGAWLEQRRPACDEVVDGRLLDGDATARRWMLHELVACCAVATARARTSLRVTRRRERPAARAQRVARVQQIKGACPLCGESCQVCVVNGDALDWAFRAYWWLEICCAQIDACRLSCVEFCCSTTAASTQQSVPESCQPTATSILVRRSWRP